jgi:hypothetical protein
MGIFSSAVEVPAVTGTDILRRGLYARLAKGALARIARDLTVGIERLEAFARNQGELPPEVKQQLAREFFNADFDPELDRLRPQPQPEPVAITVRPPSFSEMGITVPKIERNPIAHLGRKNAKPTPPARPQRPGWAD